MHTTKKHYGKKQCLQCHLLMVCKGLNILRFTSSDIITNILSLLLLSRIHIMKISVEMLILSDIRLQSVVMWKCERRHTALGMYTLQMQLFTLQQFNLLNSAEWWSECIYSLLVRWCSWCCLLLPAFFVCSDRIWLLQQKCRLKPFIKSLTRITSEHTVMSPEQSVWIHSLTGC